MLVNAYTLRPTDVKPGQEMLFVIKAIVGYDGKYRIYRCTWDGTESDIPQGSRLYLNEEEVAQAIFPVLVNAELEADNG